MERDTFYENLIVKLVWRLSEQSMESDTFYQNLIVNLVWRLSGNLIYHIIIETT